MVDREPHKKRHREDELPPLPPPQLPPLPKPSLLLESDLPPLPPPALELSENTSSRKKAKQAVAGAPARPTLSCHRDVLRKIAKITCSGAGDSVVVLHGEPGIGKSSVVSMLAKWHSESIKVVVGNCASEERRSPFFVFRSIFKRFLEHATELNGMSLAEQIKSLLLDDISLLPYHGLLNPVFGISVSTEPPPSLPVEQKAAQLVQILGVLFRKIGSIVRLSLLILIVEDVHWMDSASWSLIEHLTGESNGFLLSLLMTKRHWSDTAPPQYTRLLHRPTTTVVLMPVMKHKDVVVVAKTVMGLGKHTAVPSDVLETLIVRSGGNPLFCNELVQLFANVGALVVDEASNKLVWLEQHATVNMESIQAVIVNRLNGMDEFVLRVMHVCAVMGSVFSVANVHKLLPAASSLAQVQHALDTMEDQGLVVKGDDGGATYRFFHFSYKDAVYDHVAESDRRVLHRAVAVQLEQESGELTGLYAMLAFHWLKVVESTVATTWQQFVDVIRTVEYLKLGAKETMAFAMMHDASLLLETALPLLEKLPAEAPPGDEDDASRGLQSVTVPPKTADGITTHVARLELECLLMLSPARMATKGMASCGDILSKANALCKQGGSVDSEAMYNLTMGLIWHTCDAHSTVVAGRMATGLIKSTTDFRIILEFSGFEVFGLMMAGDVGLARWQANAFKQQFESLGSPRYPNMFPLMSGIGFLLCTHTVLQMLVGSAEGCVAAREMLENDFYDNCTDKGYSQTILLNYTTLSCCYDVSRAICESQKSLFPRVSASLLRRHVKFVTACNDCLQKVREPKVCLDEMLKVKGNTTAIAYFAPLLEVCLRAGAHFTARQLLTQWLDAAEKQEEWAFFSEHYRVQAELSLLAGEAMTSVRILFENAIAKARQQGFLLLQIRAARRLAEIDPTDAHVDALASLVTPKVDSQYEDARLAREFIAAYKSGGSGSVGGGASLYPPCCAEEKELTKLLPPGPAPTMSAQELQPMFSMHMPLPSSPGSFCSGAFTASP